MPRSTKLWEGKDDNAPIPPRVKLRIKSRANDCCQICGARVRYGGQVDHTIAIVNGGQNREDNLRYLCKTCHADKTRKDVGQKASDAKTQKHLASFSRRGRGFWKPEKPHEKRIKPEWWLDERGRLRVTFLKADKP